MKSLNNLSKYKDQGLLVIRIGLGLSFIFHGYPKLAGGPTGWERLGKAMGFVGIHFLPMLWGFLAAITETIGGLLIIAGLAFRPVCALLVINLIVAAIFTYKIDGSFDDATHALEDAIMFAGLFLIGPGVFSVEKG